MILGCDGKCFPDNCPFVMLNSKISQKLRCMAHRDMHVKSAQAHSYGESMKGKRRMRFLN